MPNQGSRHNSTDEVILYYWSANKKSSFGHLALKANSGGPQNRGFYISLWPGSCSKAYQNRPYLCQKSHPHTHSFDMDEMVMQVKPSKLILYGLNPQRIHNAYTETKSNWSIEGVFHFPGSKYQQTYVCSSLIWMLLQKGELNTIIPKEKPKEMASQGEKLWHAVRSTVRNWNIFSSALQSDSLPDRVKKLIRIIDGNKFSEKKWEKAKKKVFDIIRNPTNNIISHILSPILFGCWSIYSYDLDISSALSPSTIITGILMVMLEESVKSSVDKSVSYLVNIIDKHITNLLLALPICLPIIVAPLILAYVTTEKLESYLLSYLIYNRYGLRINQPKREKFSLLDAPFAYLYGYLYSKKYEEYIAIVTPRNVVSFLQYRLQKTQHLTITDGALIRELQRSAPDIVDNSYWGQIKEYLIPYSIVAGIGCLGILGFVILKKNTGGSANASNRK